MIYLLPVIINLILLLILLYKVEKSQFFSIHLILLLLFCSFLQYFILFNSEYDKLQGFLRTCVFLFVLFGLPLIFAFSYKQYLKKK